MKMFDSEIEALEVQIEKALAREYTDHNADQELLLRALDLSNSISAKFNSLPRALLGTGEVAVILQRQSRMLRNICRLQRQHRSRKPLQPTGSL